MQASDVMPCPAGTLPRSGNHSQQWRDLGARASRTAASVLTGHCKQAKRAPADPPANLDARTQMLVVRPIAATIARLAIPNGIVMAVQILIGLLEVYFISRLGVEALAGVAPVFPLVSLLVAVSQGAIGGGFVTAVARALGTGRISAASDYAWYAVALAVPLGLATSVIMLAFGPSLYACMGLSGDALAFAVSYSAIVFAGAMLVWLFNFLMAVIRGTGNMMVPVAVVCGAALILVPLSPALIFGALGYQGLGPSGGAVAMLVFYAIGTLAYAAYLWGRFGVLRPSIAWPQLSREPAFAILRVGGMSTVVSATTNLTLAIVTAYVALGGVEALAGYGAASRWSFSWYRLPMPSAVLSESSSARISAPAR
jgi:Na+-driven multidrug efflux pump